MSLFGESPPRSRPLFADDDPVDPSPSLFDDDASIGWNSHSAAAPPPPRRRLTIQSPPSEYNSIFSNLLTTYGHDVSAASAASVILDDASISGPARDRILSSELLLTDAGIVRSDVFVLVAMCALAQQGEPVSVDAVEARLDDLPVPDMKTLLPQERQNAISPKIISTTPVRPNVFGTSEGDPWSSGSVPTQQPQPQQREPDDIHAALRSDSGRWGMERHGSYGGLGGNPINGNGASQPHASGDTDERIRAMMKAPEEVVTVTVLPEKEGMFLFQHRNYQIASVRRNSRVVRRYSDFVWLLECLHKRYPFRALPLLPPKRLAVNGHYLSADSTFLERRRRGLTRFLCFLVRHPILSNDQLTIMFLTVPTELSVWRKQASISITDEFLSLPPLPPPAAASDTDLFETVRSGLRRSADLHITFCTLIERLSKRNAGLAADYARFATACRSLTDAAPATYALDTSEVAGLNAGLLAIASTHDSARALLTDEAAASDLGVLEDCKRQRDTLVSMRELLDRIERFRTMAASTIATANKRIAANEKRIVERPEEERERIAETLRRDRDTVDDMRRRTEWSVRVVREELRWFGYSVYWWGRLAQEWCAERVKYSELVAEAWRGLQREVEGMAVAED